VILLSSQVFVCVLIFSMSSGDTLHSYFDKIFSNAYFDKIVSQIMAIVE